MKNYKNHIAYLLLLVLFIGITPRDIIHLFHHHHDTDCAHRTYSPSIERMHTHCDFLQLQLSTFDASVITTVIPKRITISTQVLYLFNHFPFGIRESDTPRGPPADC